MAGPADPFLDTEVEVSDGADTEHLLRAGPDQHLT